MTNNPLELSDLYPQYAVKEAITQFKKLQLGLSSGSIKFKISGDVSSIDEEFKQNKSDKEEFDDLSVNLDALRLEHLQISGEAESVNEESLAISQPWVMPENPYQKIEEAKVKVTLVNNNKVDSEFRGYPSLA